MLHTFRLRHERVCVLIKTRQTYLAFDFRTSGGSKQKCWHYWCWGGEWWESWDIRHKSNIKLMEFLLNPSQIPLQRDQMWQKIFLRLIKCKFKNIKYVINCLQASPLLFKYYIINFGWVVLVCADSTDAGEGSKLWKICWHNTWMLP